MQTPVSPPPLDSQSPSSHGQLAPSPLYRQPESPRPPPLPIPSTPGLPFADQGEECAEARDSSEGRNVAVHVLVLGLGEERVLTLDPTALHVLIPALGVVSPNQGSLALAGTVELDVLHLILARREEEKTIQWRAVGLG